MTAMRAAARRMFYGLRTEGAGAAREASAVAVGVFIGCLPFYGFHLLLCWVVGRLLRLNRLKVYLAANISNPLVAPFLLFSEVQIGGWLRRGAFHPLTVETVRSTDLSVFGYDILIGSVALGATIGAVLWLVTYLSLRSTGDDALFLDLVREASDRYALVNIVAWEFARGKLRGDPVYRAAVCESRLPRGGTLVDIGCGGGLALALLAEGRKRYDEGRWPSDWNPPPLCDRLVGIETRPRVARIAREALGADATIVQADARAITIEPCRVVLLFDVLHMLAAAGQEALLSAIRTALEPGGVALIRDADASCGWRFTMIRLGNRLKAVLFGHWTQAFHFRTRDEWLACFAACGLAARVRALEGGGLFANVLFEVTVAAHASATVPPPSPTA
jgi:SAM-dependent methyltransferase